MPQKALDMRVDFCIRKNAVLEGVGATTAYLAQTVGREDVAVVDSNSDVLEGFWLDGITMLSGSLMEWARRLTGYGAMLPPYKGGDFIGSMDLPNFAEAGVGAFNAALHNFMVQYLLWRWLQVKVPDGAETYKASADAALAGVEAALMWRDRPAPTSVRRMGRRGNVATIVLHRDEIVRDIRNRAWVVGDVTPTDAGHGKHQTTDIVAGGNEDIAMRDIDLVWHELEDILFPYIWHDEQGESCGMSPVGFGFDHYGCPVGGDHGFGGVGNQGYDVWFGDVPHWHRHWPPMERKDFGTVDNAMPDVPFYEIRLALPEGLAESTVRYWRTLMHEYIVTQVLANWCALVNMDKHEALSLKVAKLREQLAVSLSCRTRPVHRPMRPW